MSAQEPDVTLPGDMPEWDAFSTRRDGEALKVEPDLGAPEDMLPAMVEFPGRYREARFCGQGGGGRVWTVFDEHLRRDVAMKKLLGAGSSSISTEGVSPGPPNTPLLTRFLREARVTGQLEHPSIVPVYELGRDSEGLPYYTMRMVRGRTLSAAIQNAKTLSGRLALLPHIVSLCQAVAYAHSRGVVHRDLKPNNVMVGEFGETMVLDWGLAKVRGQHDLYRRAIARKADACLAEEDGAPETKMGEVLGTPGYMAPEQAQGKIDEIDERTDVYALGAVLYAVLTGKAPFRGHRDLSNRRPSAEDPPPAPETLEPSLPTDLAAICRRAMEKEPDRRYASAMELADELQRFQAGALVHAYHYRLPERMSHFAKRYRAVLTTACIALALLAVAAIFFVARIVEEKNQARYALYRASIGLARQAIDNRDLHEASQRLFDAPPEDWGAEWGLLAYESNENAVTFPNDNGTSLYPELSPDGRFLAVSGSNGHTILWDVHTVQPAHTLDTGPLTKIAFSPDGRCLAAAHADGTVSLWTIQSGALLRTIAAHRKPVSSVDFAPDNERFVSTGEEPNAKMWSRANGASVRELQGGPSGKLTEARFSPDGKRVAAGANTKQAFVWDAHSGALLFELTGHAAPVESVQFSGDGTLLATGSRDNTVKLWDLQTGAERLTLRGHTEAVFDTHFLRGGAQLATVSQDKTVRVWDTATGALLERYDGFARPLVSLDVLPGERTWAVEACQGQSALFPREPFNQPRLLEGHTGTIAGLAFNPTGTLLASAGGAWNTLNDHRVILWNTATGNKEAELDGHAGAVGCAAFRDQGRQLLSGGADGRVVLWDIATRRPLREYSGYGGQVRSLALAPGEHSFVAAGWDDGDPRAILWEVQTGAQRRVFRAKAIFDAVAFHPDGTCIATGTRDATLRLWDLQSGEVRWAHENGDGEWVLAVAFSPDGRYLAEGGLSAVLSLHDARTGRIVRTFAGHTARIEALAFSPDGRRLVTGGLDNTLRIWDTATGQELLRFSKEVRRINAIAFSPRGDFLASGGFDNAVTLRPLMPWQQDAYPVVPHGSFEDRFEEYKRQRWREQPMVP